MKNKKRRAAANSAVPLWEQSDRRMLFLRNAEALLHAGPSTLRGREEEYEVTTDAEVIGDARYGPYRLMIWEFSMKRPGEWRKLCLQTPLADLSGTTGSELGQRNAYYHGGWVADEIVTLASVGLRRRIILGPMVRVDNTPRLIDLRNPSGMRGVIDPDLVSGRSNLAELQEWLNLVAQLDPQHHQRFMLASRLYVKSLETIEKDPELAYLNLVSAVEALATTHSIGQPHLSWLGSRLAKLVHSVAEPDLRTEIEAAILAREHFIGRHFVAFIVEHVEEAFWTEPKDRGHPFFTIRKDELPVLLRRIYRQRSKTLHDGEPFPPSVQIPPSGEIERGLGMSHTGRRWTPAELVPHPSFFERLVNHVLRTFVLRHQQTETDKPTAPVHAASNVATQSGS